MRRSLIWLASNRRPLPCHYWQNASAFLQADSCQNTNRPFGPAFARPFKAATGAKTLYIEPGSPWENGYCEIRAVLRRRVRQLLETSASHGIIFYAPDVARHICLRCQESF